MKVSSWIILQIFFLSNLCPTFAGQDVALLRSHLRAPSLTGAEDGARRKLFKELGLEGEERVRDGGYRNLQVGELTLKTGVIPDLLAMQVEKYKDRTFLVVPAPEGYREISFNQFNEKVEGIKKILYAEGVRQGDRIAFLSPNRPEFVEAAMGIWGLGGTVVSMSFRAPPVVWEHMLSNSDATYLVVSTPPLLQAARALKSKNPNIKKIFVLDPIPTDKLQENEISLATWEEKEAVHLPEVDIKPDDVALILFTSGTTKLPKGVPLTHKNLLYNREASRLAWETDLTDEDITLGFLPFFHVMGLPFEFLGNLYVGAKYAFPRLKPGPATPDQLLAAFKETKANVLYTVPTMLEGFKKMGEKDPTVLETLRNLKFIMSGGAPLSEEVGTYFRSQGVKVIQGEGMTDVGGAIFLSDPKRDGWQPLRLIPGMNAHFVPVEGLQGEELVLKESPTTTSGYLKNEEATAAAFKEDGFHTGDLFGEVEPGLYVYVGRTDEIFTHTTGEKTNPLPIEMALQDRLLVIEKVALVGNGRPYNIAVVQPNYASFQGKQWFEIEEEVWKVFDQVNGDLFDYSKIRRENIVLLPPGVTLPMTPKGTLIRPQVEANFAKEIEEIYSRKARMTQREREEDVLYDSVYGWTEGLKDIVKRVSHSDLTLALVKEYHQTEKVVVTGEDLNLARVTAVSRGNVPVALTDSPKVKEKVDRAVEWLVKAIAKGRKIYGVTTGFGGSAETQTSETEKLQRELIRFLNSSFGPLLPDDLVRGAMLIRANSNIKGYSGLRWLDLENLAILLNKGITPLVPLRGSITASGDLSPLGHIVAVLTGEDHAKAHYQGHEISAKEALQIAGIEPIVLGPKEGLALVNGTAVANALAATVLYDANILALLSQAATALTVEALLGTNQSYDPLINELKPHPGQVEVGKNLVGLLEGSQLAREELATDIHVEEGRSIQDRYAIRTAAQWLGPQIEVLLAAIEAITTEMNSVSDNPLIDAERNRVLHGGNFQGTPIGVSMENTRLSLQAIGKILFAQYTELSNSATNNGLPKNLAGSDPSLDYGEKGSEIGMAALQSELEKEADPVTTHVQNAELGNQDVNSLALISARYTQKGVEILQEMLTTHLYGLMQAIDLRAIERAYQKATEEAIAETVEKTLPNVVKNHKEIVPLMTKHLIKKAKTQLPFNYVYTSDKKYKPLFDVLAGEIDDVLNNDPKVEGFVVDGVTKVKVELGDASSVAAYYRNFMDDLAKQLDELLPKAREKALQQGAAHLLGNTRPLYEFIRSELGIRFVSGDLAPGPEKEKILRAIQDGRIVEPLLDAFFPPPTVEEWKALQEAEKSAKSEATDGGTKQFLAAVQEIASEIPDEWADLYKGKEPFVKAVYDKIDQEVQNSILNILSKVLAREALFQKSQGDEPDISLLPMREDPYFTSLLRQTSQIGDSKALVMSVSRFLDPRITKQDLKILLEKTDGILFFATPTHPDHWDTLRHRFGERVWGDMMSRLSSDHLDQLAKAELVVFLLDKTWLRKNNFHEADLFSIIRLDPAERAFVVPLTEPEDVAKEIHLGLSLLEHSSAWGASRLPYLLHMDLETQILLAAVARGIAQAENLISSINVQEELEQAASIVKRVVKGL